MYFKFSGISVVVWRAGSGRSGELLLALPLDSFMMSLLKIGAVRCLWHDTKKKKKSLEI